MKRLVWIFLCTMLCGMLWGCTVRKVNTTKQKDIEFTVLQKEEIPKTLAEQIAERQKEAFQITYAEEGYLYIACGYGKQSYSGYSVAVKSCYETEQGIWVHTNLIGPSREEEILETETYPYIVIKMEDQDKQVYFE